MSQENLKTGFSSDLLGAFLNTEVSEPVVIKAEDIEVSTGGLNFSEIFFEPQVGKTYRVRFVQNPNGENFTHRRVYKRLPDPERRGKFFHYVSSGNTQTCKVLELFFELNKEKKEGNALAEKKIKDYLASTNQGCSLVQIVTSDDDDIKAGEFRIWVFSTFGPNATVANLINQKVNPTPEMIEDGEVPVNIWNIFKAPVMLVQVTEAEYEGIKGRDFTKTNWTKKESGVEVKMEDNTIYQFSMEDIENGKLREQAQKPFQTLIEKLNNENLSVHNYFSYKELGDERNTEATESHLKQVLEKVSKIVPIIRDAKNIDEIKNACKVDNSSDNTDKNNSKSIFSESIPEELQNSDVLNETTTSIQNNPISSDLDEASAILQGN